MHYGTILSLMYVFVYTYTSISIASISFTWRMKCIPRWTPLALSPRKGTENTNDVRNSPLFLECCYFKIASTRCKAILIASFNKFRISQYRRRLLLITSCYSVYVQFNKKYVYLKVFNRPKRGTTVAKQTSLNGMCRTVTSFYIYRKLTWCSCFDRFSRRSSDFVNGNTVLYWL